MVVECKTLFLSWLSFCLIWRIYIQCCVLLILSLFSFFLNIHIHILVLKLNTHWINCIMFFWCLCHRLNWSCQLFYQAATSGQCHKAGVDPIRLHVSVSPSFSIYLCLIILLSICLFPLCPSLFFSFFSLSRFCSPLLVPVPLSSGHPSVCMCTCVSEIQYFCANVSVMSEGYI